MSTTRIFVRALNPGNTMEVKMNTLYGKYPKHITCECNAEEMNEEAITIRLNERCPLCNKLHQVCVTKPEVRMKQLQAQAA